MTDAQLSELMLAIREYVSTMVRETINSSSYGTYTQEQNLRDAILAICPLENKTP